MKQMMKKLKISLSAVLLTLGSTVPVMADDIEIYTSLNAGDITTQPNLMFVLDSSDSMNTSITIDVLDDYDWSVTYPGDCGAGKIFYTTTGSVPVCSSGQYFDEDANTCDHSLKRYDATDSRTTDPGPLYTAGYFTGQIAQYTAPSNTGRRNSRSLGKWDSLATSTNAERAKLIECYVDRGIHGELSSSSTKYIVDDTAWTSTVTTDSHVVWGSGANNYTMYHYNYLNYLSGTTTSTTTTRFEALKTAIIGLTDANTNINIGLMRYDGSASAEGGSVNYPVEDIKAARNDFQSRVKTMNAGGATTIAETYFEALRYFGGAEVYYGNDTVPKNQVGTTMPGNVYYDTPIIDTCQKNYIIYLTDGGPTYDHLSTAQLSTLAGFTDLSCADTRTGVESNVDNSCLEYMAKWARSEDVAVKAIDAHAGDQHIKTYTIGFALDSSASPGAEATALLQRTADAGGGTFYTATDASSLAAVFNEITAEVLAVNSTFSSPAVSVNAFNRATNLEDLYFTLFKPTPGSHWEGNLKKFKLEFDANRLPFIADVNHNAAIDPATGFFKQSSVSYWTLAADAPDGAETAIGGAASLITNTGNKYTFAGSYTGNNGVLVPSNGDLTNSLNALTTANNNITDNMLGKVNNYADVEFYDNGVIVTLPYRDAMIKWARGFDINDDDGDLNGLEDRRVMGDPLHAEPALVQYGLTDSGDADLVAYVATNDGYLHAIDAENGTEIFNFIPQEMLPKLQDIFDDIALSGKTYGLDGNVVSWINDDNNDGTISGANEHIYLYFGMRRGGRYIYSVDVTDRDSPELRWVIEGGAGDYVELGQTWSAPNVERIKMGGVDKTVLIFGGGYDTGQDVLTKRGPDADGRSIYIVDAETGDLLWRAGPDGGADLQLSAMDYSIPARVKPIDIAGDGYTDRLYVGDMGGQLWRFDIDNSASSASSVSVTGGRIADFALNNSVTDNRRFYNPPDAALIVEDGKAPYVAILAASGYRAHPLQTDTHDRVYMIRDHDVYTVPDPYVTLTESDLFDTTLNIIGEGTQAEVDVATSSLSGAQGWFITFNEIDGSFVGEKALSEPLLLDGVAIFTTFIPASAGLATNSCTTNDGTGAIYFVNTVDGTPTRDSDSTDGSGKTREDRRVLLARGGIPPTPRVIITEDGIPTMCVGTECSKAGDVGTAQKMYWYEVEE